MLTEAFMFAYKAHEGQYRKIGGLPYIVHPVEVALELARNGADEKLIAAGYLHDTIEDAGITKEEIEAAFGREIADIIAYDSEDKTKSWEERKSKMLENLSRPGELDYKMLICADKLSNLRSMYDELQKKGDEIWSGFNRGKDKQAWLAYETVKALSPLGGMPMYEELKQLSEKIFKDEMEKTNGNICNT